MARKRKRARPTAADLTLRFLFTPTPSDSELERQFGFETILRWLRRKETRAMLDAVLPYLPEHERGRPKGLADTTRHLLDAVTERVKAGEKPTPAARGVLKEHGVKAPTKGQIDHLARLWKTSAK